ncbi:MAG: carboxymuconolactone decarboxylase family protein [Candidatus Methanoplasma sp.]|jgi:AhpD family alkylhydroperoxidase|nr:carboxymuconolactone decarboxylase family protein [Candidatus Methanoplasma sp.]
MQEDPKEREIADRILASIEEAYGFIPLVNKVLSERPDKFIPMANLGKAVLEGRGELDRKTGYLAAIAASAALGGQHCIRVQMKHAVQAGATKDEILEVMLIGSYMSMTRSQSYALRAFEEMFGTKEEP